MIVRTIFLVLSLCGLLKSVPVFAQSNYAPPRNVDDILAVLDQYKPDPSLLAKARANAQAQPPDAADKQKLAQFYLERALAARQIGNAPQQVADLKLALQHTNAKSALENRISQELAAAEYRVGNLMASLHLRESMAKNLARGYVGSIMSSLNAMLTIHLALGDDGAARRALADMEQIYAERWNLDKNSNWYENERIAILEGARSQLLVAEGKYPEAEAARRRALRASEQDQHDNKIRLSMKLFTAPQLTKNSVKVGHEFDLAYILLRQGKRTEAEAIVRQIVTRNLAGVGRYAEQTGNSLRVLGDVLLEGGRFRDAEQIARAVLDIYQKIGVLPESTAAISVRRTLATVFVGQQQWAHALAEYDEALAAIKSDAELSARYTLRDINWGLAMVKVGQASKALSAMEAIVKATSGRLGNAADETAQARGVLAMALAGSGSRERALTEFRLALPALTTESRGDSDSEDGSAIRSMRVRYILEAYLDLLAGETQNPNIDSVGESFRIADVARGSALQRALSESAARAAVRDDSLATLVREEQDTRVRLGVLINLLSRLLASPPDQQLPKVIAGLREQIDSLRAARQKQKQTLEQRFPDYANLLDPKPVTLEQARAALRPGEALVSLYVGPDRTYVWAVPQQGAPAFATVPLGEKAINDAVAQLRLALDVGNAAIARFPRFDTSVAHRLYEGLLKPVEAGWKDAGSLIIVPHRALGQLPFSLLVTAPAEPGADTARFDGYRAVPWLIRKAAVTQLPSVNALTTLRALPAAAASRWEFIGFGDPYFTKQQAAQAGQEQRVQVAELAATLRNLRIGSVVMPMAGEAPDPQDGALRAPNVANSATLAQLARLPDTADEIRDIAQVLKADFNRDVFLGVNANEKNVKSMNLSDRKIVAFATHGLVPGDLNGLEQPALALTAPEVAGIDGDGLLTMEEILSLKLNADWVVLSACNTGSGDGAGSEAVSGLGRAFFYAGARSLLVSNWPVETVSARLITTEVFKRSVENPALTRAEALRQTMLWLMDNAGQKDATGKLEFTYAHPMFWAPFALIGDGGR